MNALRSLSYHPFPVAAHFRKSLVVGFTAPKAELERFLPEPFTLDLVQEEFGFLAAAIVDTEGLRPKGMPSLLGRNFVLLGYRIFARYETAKGRRLRGLYILGSETSKHSMKWLGGVFTRYRYDTTKIRWSDSDEEEAIESDSGLHVIARRGNEEDDLPEGSPFENWKEARRFAGPMPFSFSYDAAASRVISIEGVRTGWKPRPMKVLKADVPFFTKLGISNLQIANAFLLEEIPYWWKKGEVERWPH